MAQSNRAGYSYAPTTTGLPWTNEILVSLEALAQERLPEHLSTHMREARTKCHGVES